MPRQTLPEQVKRARHNAGMKIVMRRRRLLQRTRARYQPYLDRLGQVPVRALESFFVAGRQFTRGTVTSIPWQLAARLEAALLVDLVRPQDSDWPARPGTAAGSGDLTARGGLASLRAALAAIAKTAPRR